MYNLYVPVKDVNTSSATGHQIYEFVVFDPTVLICFYPSQQGALNRANAGLSEYCYNMYFKIDMFMFITYSIF